MTPSAGALCPATLRDALHACDFHAVVAARWALDVRERIECEEPIGRCNAKDELWPLRQCAGGYQYATTMALGRAGGDLPGDDGDNGTWRADRVGVRAGSVRSAHL